MKRWGARGFLAWRLTIRQVLILALLASVFSAAAREVVETDLGYHLRTGQYIWETRTVPKEDFYSYTVPGRAWVAHEWLAEVVLYLIFRAFGFGGIAVFFALAIALPFPLVLLMMRERGVGLVLGVAVAALAALAASVMWGARVLMLSLLLATVFMYLLEQYARGGPNRLWLLPPLMAVWVNLHGGYAVGFLLLGLYCLGALAEAWLGQGGPLVRRRLGWLSAVGALCLLAALLNPNGPRMLWYPFEVLGSSAMRAYVSEWPSPDFHQPKYWPFLIMLFLPFGVAALTRLRMPPRVWALVLVLGLMGLQSLRHIPFFALLAAPAVAEGLAAAGRQAPPVPAWGRLAQLNRKLPPGRARAVANGLVLLLVVAALLPKVGAALAAEAHWAAQRRFFPVEAVEYIQRHGLEGRIFNSYNWGGYLIWELYPQHQVFIDSRADLYGDDFIREYLKAYFVRPDWREPLDRYGVKYVLIEENSPLATLLRASGEWRVLYADPVAVLLERK